jgi:tetratricopeptide (TPR) repeat protein
MSSSRPRDIDVAVLRGEVELRAREPKAALEAWQRAAALEQSARTAHGLARARFAGGDVAGAEQDAHTALQQNPGHVGSRILLARIAWATSQKEKRALELLEQITAAPNRASPDEKVSAQTLLGAIHLARSRITHAENAYDAALQIDPKAAGALTGLGEALYRAGRYSEALARFEAGIQADPDDLTAKIGVAKTKLMLERPDDAEAMMKKLREAHPKSGLVAYWHGRVLEALGSREDAERAYRDAIALGDSLDVVDAFVALALVLNQSGKAEEAQDLLSDARGKLPQSPAIHKALGELALTQGRYTDAVDEIRRALELDPSDVGAKFMLGVARRRTREFDEATRIFDEVAAVDRDYPGLALERGVLHEAAGRTQEALQAYETALAKAPNDPDLMLRVGCGKVSAGAGKQALELLRKVLAQRPNSAETNHCVGRALLAEGTNLAEALRALERAVELDANRAEYHLYVGWAANEAGRVARAESALKRALELDQGLADAYWQRGVLRARQGAVKDAVQDLNRALELRPSRYEAHATLADAYYDLGREPAAINEWHKAVTADPNQPLWRFRYGKLLLANRKNEAAAEHLGKAIELTDATDPKPRWLWEAHHLMARALGPRADAAPHWKAFLRDGPRDSPYRGEAKAALEKLGQRWDGD